MAVSRSHSYGIELSWPEKPGDRTTSYIAYSRDHRAITAGKPALELSADLAFRGSPTRHNPEELLVTALASCHMLWYLDLCARTGIVVTAYNDQASGEMIEGASGEGRFKQVLLRPRVTIINGAVETALSLHVEAHRECFIANSVNFPVICEPTVLAARAST